MTLVGHSLLLIHTHIQCVSLSLSHTHYTCTSSCGGGSIRNKSINGTSSQSVSTSLLSMGEGEEEGKRGGREGKGGRGVRGRMNGRGKGGEG